VPAEPESPDPDGARLLIDQARELRKLGRAKTALKLTRAAAGLSHDVHTLLALADAYRLDEQPAPAAVAALAAAEAAPDAPDDERAESAVRAANLLKQADPNLGRIDSLVGGFAGEAERLAALALAGGDDDTAGQIVGVVLKLLPDRAGALALKRKLANVPLTCTAVPDLTGDRVAFKVVPAGGQVRRSARSVEFRARAAKLPGGLAGTDAQLILKPVHWGKFVRVAFRIRHVGDRGSGYLRLDLSPAGWGAQLRSRYKTHALELTFDAQGADYRVAERMPPEQLNKLFRPDDTYEVTFEKNGATVTVSVDGRQVATIELGAEGQRRAARENVALGFGGVGPPGRDVTLKLTLREFACSGDCLGRQ
jgi:hypothetical protein